MRLVISVGGWSSARSLTELHVNAFPMDLDSRFKGPSNWHKPCPRLGIDCHFLPRSGIQKLHIKGVDNKDLRSSICESLGFCQCSRAALNLVA
jgi:hypothetical protein